MSVPSLSTTLNLSPRSSSADCTFAVLRLHTRKPHAPCWLCFTCRAAVVELCSVAQKNMMALEAHALAHDLHSNPPTLEEEDDFYTKVLGLRDAVLAGTHPTITLPASAIAALKASLITRESPDSASQRVTSSAPGGALANGLSTSTNEAVKPTSMFPGLPGLGSSAPSTGGATSYHQHTKPQSAGLDPIFLEKSNSLVRAEGQLKRQRIERELFENWEKRKSTSSRDKELLVDTPSNISIDTALTDAQQRVKPVTGLRSAPRAASIATSFDENDYYSSQVQSEWSSDAGSAGAPDQAVGADYENLDRYSGGAPASSSKARGKQPVQANGALHSRAENPSVSQNHPHFYTNDPDGVNEADDEDEEYSPPEPAAFDSFYDADTTMDMQDLVADEDDDSEYEPGEVTQGSVVVTPYPQNVSSAQPSPQVPIYRNHLSHIAAPQPNRVSPLAVQKGPSIELELVNGRPEIVSKPQKRHVPVQSRPSSASPSGPGTGASARKKKKNNLNKKRKREVEATNRSGKRQERQNEQSPLSPMYQEPYIKPEPVSPPPFPNLPEAQPYTQRYTNHAAPIQLDPESPRNPHQPQYVYASTPRYDYAPQMPPPTVIRVSSASGHRPPQRDKQDLRRVASLHYAQRPASPAQRVYSPAGPYTPTERAYVEPQRQASVAPFGSPYHAVPVPRQEPIRLQEYRESSPAMMAPPPPPPRRVVVDQYGNRYYAEQPVSQSRASVAPTARHPDLEPGYERAPSRMQSHYLPPDHSVQYEPAEPIMAPPPPPARRPHEQPVEYIDSNGYRVREYSSRPAEPIRYSHAPTSPVYQQQPQYEQMPPPSARPAPRDLHYEMPPPPMPQALHEPAPQFVAPPRAYSVRPDAQDPQPITYAPRQASVAPVQYVRHDVAPPARAMSVMPGPEYGAPAYQHRAPSYAPQPAVRYVDEYGREVAPRDVRQASQFRY